MDDGKRDMALAMLREKTAALPADGPPPVAQAHRRALQATQTVAEALQVDPTLTDGDRCRDVALLNELLRQIKPLSRQVQVLLEQRRLAELPGTQRQIARLGHVNPLSPEELDELSKHAIVVAERIRDAALPDWNTPERIRERSARLLPSPDTLEDIAEQLRHAVRHAVELPYPDPEAVRLTALADQITLDQPKEAP